ncbi:hypothetical protein [Nocardia sp. NPDC051832]|uniref:hypothetical protein n=1 Tax=Nocardia sp. NPDC051832 TaxID=3155673 RepID=UPI0034363C0D
MMHLIANEFSILGNDILNIGRAVIELIQDIINLSTPGGQGGHGGGEYPFA